MKSLIMALLSYGCADYSKPQKYISTNKFEIFKEEEGLNRDLEITKQGLHYLKIVILSECLEQGYSNYFLYEETMVCKSSDQGSTTIVQCTAMARCTE